MELLSDFMKECQISYQVVKASSLHQKALLIRIEIAENTVTRWLKEGGNLKDILYEEINLKKMSMSEDMVFISPKKTEKILKENVSRETIERYEEDEGDLLNDQDYEEAEEDLSEIVDEMVENIEEDINLEELPSDFPF